MNHQVNCSEKCLVYLLTCNKCFKQYVGEILDEFRRRWNNYKSNNSKVQRLEPCMEEHVFSHFSMADHDGFLNVVSMTFIDETDPSYALRREDYWRQMIPYALNIEDCLMDAFVFTPLHGNINFFTQLCQHVLRIIISE